MSLGQIDISAAFGQLSDLAEGFDRSWSFSANGFEERALFFLPATHAAHEALIATATALNFAPAGLADFNAALPDADAIGLALSRSGSVRLYLQYWDVMTRRIKAGDVNPAPLYLGIKRFAGGAARRDTYYCLPLAPESEYRPEMEAALLNFGAEAKAVTQLLDQLSPETCIWTRTQGADRTSWLATVRRAGLPSPDVANALRPVSARPGVQAVIDALESGSLLHIAGGEDSQKGAFLTFYVETDRNGMTQFTQDLTV